MSMTNYGLSDLLFLANTAYNICQYWQDAPEDLRDLLKKFEYVGQQLELLNNVLKVAGCFKPYEHAEDLKALLEEANAFFKKHKALLDGTVSSSKQAGVKAGKLVRLKLDEDKIKRIDRRIDDQTKKMHDFKTHFMFMASASTLMRSRTELKMTRHSTTRPERVANSTQGQVSSRQQPLLLTLSDNSDTISVVSEAWSALQLASDLRRSTPESAQSELETIISSSPDLVALSSSGDREIIDNFLDETELMVEKLELYSEQATPVKHLEELAKIALKAQKLVHDLRPTKAGMSAESRKFHLPTLEASPQSFPDSLYGSPALRKYAFSSSDPAPAATLSPQDDDLPSLGQPAKSMTNSSSTQTGSDEIFSMRSLSIIDPSSDVGVPAKKHINLEGWVKIFAPKQTGKKPIRCNLDITLSEGSVCLCAVAKHERRRSSTTNASMMPTAMTPGMLMHGEQMDIEPTSLGPLRTFQHSFTHSARPVPHVLHPSAEDPKLKQPYAVTFHDRQYLSEEGVGARWTTELQYTFANKTDRDNVREEIFGKKLLMCAGTDKITFTYIACHQHAVTLWKDETTHVRTITFYRDTQNNRSHPPRDMEYKILGIQDLRRAERDGQPLALNVERIDREQTYSLPPSRRSSSISTSTIASGKVRSRDDMSCSIFFSENADKREFVGLLRQKPQS